MENHFYNIKVFVVEFYYEESYIVIGKPIIFYFKSTFHLAYFKLNNLTEYILYMVIKISLLFLLL